MHRQKKNWTVQVIIRIAQQDVALKELKQNRKIAKWSLISKILDQEYDIKGKNGKRCRERYQNHLCQQLKKQLWTQDEQKLLQQIHNEKGNKWAEIAKVLGRSDNSVKNHYHSKLRKGVRRINCRINFYFKGEFKPLKNNIISKIVQTAEQIYDLDSQDQQGFGQACFEMKNRIVQHSKDFAEFTPNMVQELRRLISDLSQFNQTFKKKPKKSEKHSESFYRKTKLCEKNVMSHNSESPEQNKYDNSQNKRESQIVSGSSQSQLSPQSISKSNLFEVSFGLKNKISQNSQKNIKYCLRNRKPRVNRPQSINAIQKDDEQAQVPMSQVKKEFQFLTGTHLPKSDFVSHEPFRNYPFFNHNMLPPMYLQCFNYPFLQPFMNPQVGYLNMDMRQNLQKMGSFYYESPPFRQSMAQQVKQQQKVQRNLVRKAQHNIILASNTNVLQLSVDEQKL